MEERLQTGLRTWFEFLPIKGLLWEYHLILDEIAWWCNFDPYRLIMILKSEAGQSDVQVLLYRLSGAHGAGSFGVLFISSWCSEFPG
jgi:hypothetical protein